MKLIVAFIFSLLIIETTFAQKPATNFVTDDIAHFWQAYDKIITTTDSSRQYAYLNTLFIDQGTPGLKALMQARSYTGKSYIDAIHQYPLFWKSIRSNMFKAPNYARAIAADVLKLKALYPALRPAKIYFTVGAFRSGGTTQDSMILIGSEIAMADEHTVTQEFTGSMTALVAHFKSSPINNLVFTNVHEYVHTQQKTTVGNTLLAQCLLEGVAEFIAEKATGKKSALPALSYGNQHAVRIKQVFASQMYNTSNGYWLYSNAPNEFNIRDLGYYVGYAICKQYYTKATSKPSAIKKLIELDYNNEQALNQLVEQSGYFDQPMQTLFTAYQKGRPVVTNVAPLNKEGKAVSAATTQITIHFSAPMDQRYRNFEAGPLGIDHLMRIKRFVSYAADGKSATFEVALQPNQHYQLTVGEGFRDLNGVNLMPYLIDFSTGGN